MPRAIWPSYLGLGLAEIRRRAEISVRSLESCEVCPRNCRVNRLVDEARVCSTGRLARVSTWFPHFGEEDCLRGSKGSGTIFFSPPGVQGGELSRDRSPPDRRRDERSSPDVSRVRPAPLDERAARRLPLF